MSNLVKTVINISDLEVGMTVEKDGELLTVSKNCVTHCELFGWGFRGDRSKQKITRVEFLVPTNKGVVRR